MATYAIAEEGVTDSLNAGWMSFRNGGSSSVPADALLPTKWTPTSGIAWQVELPGYGQSSPLVVQNQVILTAVEGPQKEKNLVVGIDRRTGEERW